jgi:L-lysine exporter family protein LysE/ArgO
MIHLMLTGLLLGWGAAAPIGPLNLEIIRRNLSQGFGAGMGLGIGASSGDITYLILLSTGSLVLLKHVLLLRMLGALGACVLSWFAFQALTQPIKSSSKSDTPLAKPAWRHGLEGYLLVLINPYTVLFWGSVSSQVALLGHSQPSAIFELGIGVISGVFSWALGINLFIHHTKHKLSPSAIHRLNQAGGVIILGFAIFFMCRAIIG